MININCILTPLIKREIPFLIDQIKGMYKPRESHTIWVISIDGKWSDDDKDLIKKEFDLNKHLSKCCAIYFISCSLSAEESVYIKKIHDSSPNKLPYGLKSGPNMQFFRSINHLIKYKSCDAAILLETDAIPLKDGWLDGIEKEINHKEFMVAGSIYGGQSKLPASIAGHLNGNSVYNISNPDFKDFLDLWENLLKFCIEKDPSLAYDVVLTWALYYKNGLKFDGLDKIESIVNSKFLSLNSILNISGEYENSSKYKFVDFEGASRLKNVCVLHTKAGLKYRSKIKIDFNIANYLSVGQGYIAYDNDWQYPAVTEKHAFTKFKELCSFHAKDIYFAFPWATYIDLLHHKKNSEEFRVMDEVLLVLSKLIQKNRKVITVCQHIFLLDYLEKFKEIGITDIYWSHMPKSLPDVELRIHPFPLYPVHHPSSNTQLNETVDRQYLFTFVGAKAKYVGADAKGVYLSESRNRILEMLGDDPNGYVIGRDGWHFERIVYSKQIEKSNLDGKDLVSQQSESEYIKGLKNSIFSLCPSGTGPNTIRLWESLAYSSIPVILADTYLPPGDMKLWKDACIFLNETSDNIEKIPEILRELSKDQFLISRKLNACSELYKKYGHDYFVYDIHRDILVGGFERGARLNNRSLLSNSNSLSILKSKLKKIDVLNSDSSRFLSILLGNAILTDARNLNKYLSSSPEFRNYIISILSNLSSTRLELINRMAESYGVKIYD